MSWWLASQATGAFAVFALALTMVAGIGIPGLDRRRSMVLHEIGTLAAVLSATAHVAIVGLLGASGVPALAIVLPFASDHARAGMTFGSLGLWGLAVVTVSTLVRDRIGPAGWRVLHAVAYGTLVLVVAHALVAGRWSAAWYAPTLGAVVGAAVWRIAMGQVTDGRQKNGAQSLREVDP